MQELYAHQRSVIHQLDARVKLIFTLAFIIFLSLTPSRAWPAYILFLTVTLSATILSQLGIRFVLIRSLLALPFALAAIPLVFTGPPPLAVLDFPGGSLSYSPAGLVRFTSIAVKSWISIQAAILLAASTRFPELMTALQQIKVPKVFVAIITLMWRYLFVISEEVTRMLRARSSRSSTISGSRQSGGSITWRARVTGGMAGSLLLRSIERSERVYAAMLSRGYNGELPHGQAAPLSARDLGILVLGFAFLSFLFLIGILTGD